MKQAISPELWRFVLVILVAILIGQASHQWIASLIVALLGYQLWIWVNLWQLHRWLQDGAIIDDAPEASGLWANTLYHIQRLQQQNLGRKAQLRQLVDKLQKIITHLPFATVVLNSDNEIQWFNQHAIATLGLRPETDHGQRVDNLLRLPELQIIFHGTHDDTRHPGKSHEFIFENPFGPPDYLAMQLIPVEKDLKLLIARDVTEQICSQHVRRNFVANASHELRTPLTVISGYIEMAQSSPELRDETQQMLTAAAQQTQRMHQLVEDLLMISRLENSSIKDEDFHLMNVSSHIRETITNLKNTFQVSQQIVEELDETLQLRGSPSEIISVINNLVTNAIRHTPGHTRILVSWKQTVSGEGALTVFDNGPGIPIEHIPHLTERFYRVDKGRSRETGGTGLGLAIVQHIAHRHRARFEIDSEPGQGSKFRLVFPANLVCSK
jgi:two-component system phosphate regulon sensor histidine kinase PhoR